jgi:hypothetical protein
MNTLQQLRKDLIENHEKTLAFLDSKIDEYAPIFEKLEALELGYISVSDGYISFNLTGDKHKLTTAFGILRRHGYLPNSRPEPKSSTYSTYFKKEGVTGLVFFNFSSTQCRRVKTGTVTKEVTEDVYEIVCDEQEYPEVETLPMASVADEIPF